jgi:hypothetical protein
VRIVERVVETARGDTVSADAVLATIIEMLADLDEEFQRLKAGPRDRAVVARCIERKRSVESLTAWLMLRTGALKRPRLASPSADEVREDVKLLKKDRDKVKV